MWGSDILSNEHCTLSRRKINDIIRSWLWQMLAGFQNYFIFEVSKKLAIKPLSCFPPRIIYVTTLPLRNLKCKFYHLPLQLLQKLDGLHWNSFILLNIIHIIWHVLPWHASDSTVTVCHVWGLLWVLYLRVKQCVSSMRVPLHSWHYLQLQSFIMGDTHVNFIKPVAPAPRPEPSELQSLHRNLPASLPQRNS